MFKIINIAILFRLDYTTLLMVQLGIVHCPLLHEGPLKNTRTVPLINICLNISSVTFRQYLKKLLNIKILSVRI